MSQDSSRSLSPTKRFFCQTRGHFMLYKKGSIQFYPTLNSFCSKIKKCIPERDSSRWWPFLAIDFIVFCWLISKPNQNMYQISLCSKLFLQINHFTSNLSVLGMKGEKYSSVLNSE